MASSKYFRRLNSRIKFLEDSILPNEKVNGNYTKKESDLIRSYVLLVHAEIENYLEDIVREKAKKALQKWMVNRKRSNCLLSIMTLVSNEINWEKKDSTVTENIETRINIVVKHFINKLDNNHGIKSKNIKDLFLPIGIELADLDDTWLIEMDEFGKERGLFAHSTIHTQSQIDLITQKNRINNQIIPYIRDLDEKVKSLI